MLANPYSMPQTPTAFNKDPCITGRTELKLILYLLWVF